MVASGTTSLFSQGIAIGSSIAEMSEPSEDFFSELTHKSLEAVFNEENASKDIIIKASRFNIDLNKEADVDFSVRSAWAKDFVWKFGDGSVTSGYQNVKHHFKSPGTYEVTLLASDHARTARKTVTINVVDTSIPLEMKEMGHYIVFPANNKLEAEIKLDLPKRERHLKLQIQDIEGREVFEYEIGRVRKKAQIMVDLKNLEDGKYYAILKGKTYSLVSRMTVVR